MYHNQRVDALNENLPHDAAKIRCATTKTQCSQINKYYKKKRKKMWGNRLPTEERASAKALRQGWRVSVAEAERRSR